MSTQIDLGPVLSIPKGDWNADTTYERLNMVRHNSAAWICNVATSKGVEPTEDSADWYLQVKDTSSVTSVNGMKGDVVIELTETETPPANDNSNRIATTEWVTDKLGDVDLSGIKDDTVLAAINASGSDDGTGDISIADIIAYIDKSKRMKSVGDLWFGFDAKSKPAEVLLYAGEEVSRGAYGDHWNFISNGNRTIITETEWQAQVAIDGFCPYFSSGDGSTTYRFPLVKGVHPKFVAALAEAGQYVKEGLPNVKASVTNIACTNTSAYSSSGALSGESVSTIKGLTIGGDTTARQVIRITMNLAEGNSIYGNSDTVQPPALTFLIGEYVVGSVATVGEADAESLLASVTTLESNVGALESGSGFSTAGKAEIASWWTPSTRYIDISLGASGARYTAPADGYFYVDKIGTAGGQFIVFENASDAMPGEAAGGASYATEYHISLIRPVKKGTSLSLRYTLAGATRFFRFVYAEGAE